MVRCVQVNRGKERVMMSRDFFRETGELTLEIPALPRPTIKKLWKDIELNISIPASQRQTIRELQEKIESIERDTSSTRVVTLKLGTVLRPTEEQVDDHEYERRLAPKLPFRLGYQHADWLVKHQGELPELNALLGNVYCIDFHGLGVVFAFGSRGIPCLIGYYGQWFLRWKWFGGNFNRRGRVAVCGFR